MEVSGVSSSLSEYYAELAKLRAKNASKDSASDLFGKTDADGSGGVNAAEFATLFSQAQTAATATAENGTGNGGAGDPPPPLATLSTEEIESLFAEADSDGDGALSIEEFATLRDKLRPSPPGDGGQQGPSAGSIEETEDSLTLLFQLAAEEKEELESLFAGADADGDGVLSIEEFTALRDKLRSASASENQQEAAVTLQDVLSLLNASSGQASLFDPGDESSSARSVFADLLKNFGDFDADTQSALSNYIQELVQKAYSA